MSYHIEYIKVNNVTPSHYLIIQICRHSTPKSLTINTTQKPSSSNHHLTMASSPFISLLLLLIISLSSSSFAQPSFRPKALVLPVTKDQTTLQYTTVINQRTPLVPASVVFDLGGRNLWVDCDRGYVSSTYRSPRCRSAVCSRAGSDG